jgi:hypothetical protein
LAAEKDVFSHAELLGETQLLVDESDAKRVGSPDVGHGLEQTVDVDAPFVRLNNAAEDIKQRGFAGAILTDNGQCFAGAYVQTDAAQRLNAWKRLADGLELK